MHKYLLIVSILVFFCTSCFKNMPGEHGTLAFENNSSDTVYVIGGILNTALADYRTKQRTCACDRKMCEVAPYSINYEIAPIYGSGVAYSYENVFFKTKVAERCLVYVVPFYSIDDKEENKSLYDYKMVCYELTYEDLQSLGFHLYYPPNEKMKDVKMDPPYETFAN